MVETLLTVKAIKYVFILLLVTIIAGAIYFSLQDGSYNVTRKASIEAPRSLIYEQMANFKNWNNWNAHTQDDQVQIVYGDQTAGVDATYIFTDEYGEGTITIAQLDPDRSILMDFVYKHSLGTSTASITYELVQTELGTNVTMNIVGDRALADKFFEAITGNNLEADLGLMYEESLENLDQYLEEQMDQHTINPDGFIDYSGGYYLYISSSSQMDNLPVLQSQIIQKIRSYMTTNNIDSYGAPMVIYEKIDDDLNNVIFSAGIPVRDRVITATNSTILCGFQEPSQSVKVTLKGAYKYLPDAWQIAQGFITVNGLDRSEQPPFEIYKTNSYKEPNPANYITEVYFPVQ